MSTYDFNAIADNEIDTGSPVNPSLMTRLARNWQAAFAGASGAPKVQTPAIETNAVTLAKLNIGTRSFSGSLSRNSNVLISLSDLYAFSPIFSGQNQDVSLIFARGGGGYSISNASDEQNRTYSINWRYLSA